MRSKTSIIYKYAAFFTLLALISPVFALNVRAQRMRRVSKGLTENQKVLHVLNRLGFGAKPGDVEMVGSMGVKRYIESQLNPNYIDDSAIASVLNNFEILDMETSEIFAKYPNPGALIRMLEGNGRRGNAAARNRQNNDAMKNDENAQEKRRSERRERRRKLIDLYQKYDLKPANQIMTQVQSSRILRATYSKRQLEEVMVDFWSNHFNVYSRKAATRWYIPSYERDVIRKHALGNFRDLVLGTAKHPAMLFYLDNFQSVSPNAGNNRNRKRLQRAMKNGRLNPRIRQRLKNRGLTDKEIDERIKQIKSGGNRRNKRGINENYARELMELHTLGVDGGYTQEDIKEVAKAFTGWTIFDPRGNRKIAGNTILGRQDRQSMRQARQYGISANTESGTFIFANRLHDKGEKTVLGHKINAGGMNDGLEVIDILVSHPSTAKFIAKKLAVKFVNDKPSEGLINRVAKAFQKSNGDIKTTLRALFYDKEFFAKENYRAKIKTPFELMVSSLRALNTQTKGSNGLIALLNRMGEPLYGYQAPTGYPDTAADWVNTGALLERMNFAVALASNRIPQTNVNLKPFEASDQRGVLDKAIDRILSGEINPQTKSTLVKQLAQPLPQVTLAETSESNEMRDNSMRNNRRRGRNRRARLRQPRGNPEIFKVVGLLLGSPDFQRQ